MGRRIIDVRPFPLRSVAGSGPLLAGVGAGSAGRRTAILGSPLTSFL